MPLYLLVYVKIIQCSVVLVTVAVLWKLFLVYRHLWQAKSKADTSSSALGLKTLSSDWSTDYTELVTCSGLVNTGWQQTLTGQQLWDKAKKRLEEESHGSQDAHGHKHPEEDSINHHGNILPVILHLRMRKRTQGKVWEDRGKCQWWQMKDEKWSRWGEVRSERTRRELQSLRRWEVTGSDGVREDYTARMGRRKERKEE